MKIFKRPFHAAGWRMERDFFLPFKLPKINWGIKYVYSPPGKKWTGWIPVLRHRFCNRLYVSERIVEIPFLFQNLTLKPPARILDFGCGESLVSLNLASLGHRVVGYDLNGYEFDHPNLEVIEEDFLQNNLADESFDGVVAISSVEHAGLTSYGSFHDDNPARLFDSDEDRRIAEEFKRILRPGGRLIITVPYGRKDSNYWTRSYDRESLQTLLKGYNIDILRYYRANDDFIWSPIRVEEMKKIDNLRDWVRGVALVSCRKLTQ